MLEKVQVSPRLFRRVIRPARPATHRAWEGASNVEEHVNVELSRFIIETDSSDLPWWSQTKRRLKDYQLGHGRYFAHLQPPITTKRTLRSLHQRPTPGLAMFLLWRRSNRSPDAGTVTALGSGVTGWPMVSSEEP
jgi:hypothetical protein